jgi:regulatory protein
MTTSLSPNDQVEYGSRGGAIASLIVSITRQPRRRRADVLLDDGSVFALSLELIAERGLVAGARLTPKRRQELEADDARRGAIAAALRLLAGGSRSERDLHDRLRRRSYPRAAVDAAIARMRELGYLDDAAFARSWVQGRQAATPRSRRYLQFELSQKGVARELIADAVEPVSDEDAAFEAAGRRLRGLAGVDRTTFERRLAGFLTARGFGYRVTRAVIDRCWSEIRENAEN